MNASSKVSRSPRYGALAVAAAIVLVLLFLFHVVETLALVVIAILFAIYLGGVTDFLQRRVGLERRLGLLVSLLVTAGGVATLGWMILPAVLQQVRDLSSILPSTVAGWTTYLLDLGQRYPVVRSVLPDTEAIQEQIATVQANLAGSVRELIPYLFSGVRVVIHFVSIIVMAIYLTLRPNVYLDGLVRLIPVGRRDLARGILHEIGTTLRAWIGAQMVAMVILAGLTWIGLLALEVPFALAFAVFTGVAVIVPFFGTLVSTLLPAFFVLGLENPLRALLVLLLGVVVHLVEANLVHPLIMQRQIRLPPALSIVSVLVMADLFGAVGLVLAVPVLAVSMVVIRRVYVEEILEKKKRSRKAPTAPLAPTGEEEPPVLQVRRLPTG